MKHECKRCGYTWDSLRSSSEIRCCPRCKSYKWREEPKGAIKVGRPKKEKEETVITTKDVL